MISVIDGIPFDLTGHGSSSLEKENRNPSYGDLFALRASSERPKKRIAHNPIDELLKKGLIGGTLSFMNAIASPNLLSGDFLFSPVIPFSAGN